MADTKRFFWLSCHDRAEEKSRHLRLHQVRDGAAFQELASIAFAAGYRYGGLLLNIPRPGRQGTTVRGRPEDDRTDWKSQFMPNDLLIMPTRPAIDDPEVESRKGLPRSDTQLERSVIRELQSRVFVDCWRARVTLVRQLRGKFKVDHREGEAIDYGDRARIDFFQHGWPAYQRLLNDPKDPRRNSEGPTAGYLVFVKSMDIDGAHPDLLVVFGMSGTATLVWANVLRTRLHDLVRRAICGQQSTIVVGEVTPRPGAAKDRP